jgi:O-6-methylguanine DNA methyltransferase
VVRYHFIHRKLELFVTFQDGDVIEILWEGDSSYQKELTGSYIEKFQREMTEYLDGERATFSISCRFIKGTDFQKRVWHALKEVSYAQTCSYKEIGEMVGLSKGQQAIGQAVSKNPIAILFPCHRIIKADGSLGGFAGGLKRKRMLLELEDHR